MVYYLREAISVSNRRKKSGFTRIPGLGGEKRIPEINFRKRCAMMPGYNCNQQEYMNDAEAE